MSFFGKIDGGDALLISNAMAIVSLGWLAQAVLREQLRSYGGFFAILSKSWRILRGDPAGVKAGLFESFIALSFICLGGAIKALASWDFRFFSRPISNEILFIGTALLVIGALCGVRVFDRRFRRLPYRIPTNWPWIACGLLCLVAAWLSYVFQR